MYLADKHFDDAYCLVSHKSKRYNLNFDEPAAEAIAREVVSRPNDYDSWN